MVQFISQNFLTKVVKEKKILYLGFLNNLSLLGVNPFAMIWMTCFYIFLKLVDISTKLSSFFLCRPPDEKTYLVRVIGEGSIGEIVVWVQHLL